MALVVAIAALLSLWHDVTSLDPSAERAALAWLDQHPALGQRVVLIVDFTRPSFLPRAYLFDPSTHTVRERFWVAHGEGSGWASVDVVSNTPGTHASSAGAFETGQVYEGRHGLSLRLLGLEPGINDEAYARSIVLHGAPYASPWSIATNLGRLGRSEGCLVLDPEVIDGVVEELGTGSLVYVHASLDARAPRPTTLDRPFSARAR